MTRRDGRVLVVGDLVTDVVAVSAGPLAEGTDTAAAVSVTGGGAGANTAAWLARVSRPVTLVAAVGNDAVGQQRVSELEASGVRCAVARYPTATGTVVVISHGVPVHPGGGTDGGDRTTIRRPERTMLCDRGANAWLTPGDVDAAVDNAADAVHLHLSGYPLFDPRTRPAGLRALAAARAAGWSTSVDAASAAPLRHVGGSAFLTWVRGVDLLFANRDEAEVLGNGSSGEELARTLARTVRTAVVKLGRDGAVWAGPDGRVVAGAAYAADVVDVTGAGDAFAAGAVDAWLAGSDADDVLRAGARSGADAVARVGARPYP